MGASDLSHIDERGRPRMVDVGGKAVTRREAVARTLMRLPQAVASRLADGELTTAKGPVFATAIVAGVMAAKRTHELIPFCHPLGLDDCDIDIEMRDPTTLAITCRCRLTAKTGVEMEALTGASVAALTVYDMCKALSHDIVIGETRLIAKTGGKSDFHHED
ncbi:MAG TPA: cyclic pyranopterin monophosphate synthase MoaC [Woeseiaceae bacterium]|nr:cyclic pyranopterin monophosphate synthase MoaC [Woeseiaceae bacterium]